MSEKISTDIIIIGAGPGGYVGAIRAAQLGAEVVVVERDEVGGTCLNRGCIPAKAFVESAVRYDQINEARRFGLEVKEASFNFANIQKRKQRVVKRIVKGVEGLLKERNITVIRGEGSFVDKNTVVVKDDDKNYTITADNIVIATGSTSLVPSFIPGSNGKNVITSKELLDFDFVPDSMIIIGGGVIGCEFASVFNTFGTKIEIVEMLDSLIPMEDQDMGKELEQAFKRKRIKVNTSCKVTKIEDGENNKKIVTYLDPKEKEQEISADYVLISIGRISVMEGLNLDTVGIEASKHGVKVNSRLQTNVNNVYAIGDVIATKESPMLAYTASEEGEVAVENIMGHDKEMSYDAIPSCIFTSPEVGTVGLTEEKAKELYSDIKVGMFPFMGIGKAVIHNETRGQAKVILDGQTHQILGIHIIGPHATEIVGEAALAVKNKLKAEDLIKVQHCHPVLHEILKEATLDALGRAIHK